MLKSFDDCPYHCKNGYLFNPVTKVKSLCPYCSEKRDKIIKGQLKDEDSGRSVFEVLNIPRSLIGVNFDTSMLFRREELRCLESESVKAVTDCLEGLLSKITLGEIPKCSYLFNFGRRANIYAFACPYLLKAYKFGLTVAPLIFSYDLFKLRTKETKGEWGSNFDDYISADICVIVIDAGASQQDIYGVLGLMQLRAFQSKPTLIITQSWSGGALFGLVAEEEDSVGYDLAKLISVQYAKIKEENTVPEEVPLSPPPQYSANISNRPATRMTEQQFSNMVKENFNI